MLELFVFLITLAIIRSWHRRQRPEQTQPRSTRIDIYHHFDGGPGETWPEENPGKLSPEELTEWERNLAGAPLLLTERVDNIVPLRRRK